MCDPYKCRLQPNTKCVPSGDNIIVTFSVSGIVDFMTAVPNTNDSVPVFTNGENLQYQKLLKALCQNYHPQHVVSTLLPPYSQGLTLSQVKVVLREVMALVLN